MINQSIFIFSFFFGYGTKLSSVQSWVLTLSTGLTHGSVLSVNSWFFAQGFVLRTNSWLCAPRSPPDRMQGTEDQDWVSSMPGKCPAWLYCLSSPATFFYFCPPMPSFPIFFKELILRLDAQDCMVIYFQNSFSRGLKKSISHSRMGWFFSLASSNWLRLTLVVGEMDSILLTRIKYFHGLGREGKHYCSMFKWRTAWWRV